MNHLKEQLVLLKGVVAVFCIAAVLSAATDLPFVDDFEEMWRWKEKLKKLKKSAK